MILCKLCQVLVDIKYNTDGDNQEDGENIGADKLLDDIPIQTLDITERVDISHP